MTRFVDSGLLAAALEFTLACLVLALAALRLQTRRLRESRRIAEHAANAKNLFLANMSHEIRTPLNGILAVSEILANSDLTPDQREMAGLVLCSAESLSHIVNDILDFSKMESANLKLECVAFDLGAQFDDVVRLFEPRARQKNLSFEFRIASDTPRVILGDPLRFRQVLVNLLSNAIKFTENGGITLEVACAGDPGFAPALLVRITDTGIGIAPNVRRNLFRAFTQGETGNTRRYGGAGLGLAISLRLVTLMGGTIGFESEPGRGATFWFVIPAPAVTLPDAVIPGSEHAHAPTAAPAMPRILVVEDNPVNRMVAVRALGKLGCETEVAPSGEAALNLLAGRSFDLVFMDCQMPGMDGYETTAEMRRRERAGRRIPIVAMTANATEGNRERCISAGMDDFIGKPFRLATLEAALQRWLALPPARHSSAA